MLTALGKWTELGTHVRGAVRNGVTEVEIRESLLHSRYVFVVYLHFGLWLVNGWAFEGGSRGKEGSRMNNG